MLSSAEETRTLLLKEEKQRKIAEKERDYYFGKLRDIELLLHMQKSEENDALRAIKTILFAKEDENIEVDEEGNIII
jgi:hypothetical protein